MQARATKTQKAYEIAKDRARRRSAEITLVGQDISPLPPIRNPSRRQQADRDFRCFCESCFSHLFALTRPHDSGRSCGPAMPLV